MQPADELFVVKTGVLIGAALSGKAITVYLPMFFLDQIDNFITGIANPPLFITETLESGSGNGSLRVV